MRFSPFRCAASSVPAAAAAAAALGLFTAMPAAYASRQTTHTVESGDFFTIYDFAGLVSGSNSQSANWTFSSALLGPTAQTTFPEDDPALTNLTWTYSGPTITNSTTVTGFSELSLFGGQRTDFYTAEDTFYNGPIPVAGSTIGRVNVAAAPTAPVPEPSEWLAMGMAGASVMGLMLRARRRRS